MMPFTYRFEVPDAELYDVGNWHSPYFFLAFFKARIALFESFGVTQEKIKEAGCAIVIDELHSKYRKPLLKGDIALIEISLMELGDSYMIFLYKVRKEGDTTLKIRAEGITKQFIIDREKIVKIPLPLWIREPLLKMDKVSWPEWIKPVR